MKRQLRRLLGLLGYFAIPASGALSPLLVIPAVSSTYGPDGWAVMAIGQSIGSAAAVIGEMGWGVVGPQQLPRLSGHGRVSLYRTSLASRLTASLPLALVAALIAALLAPYDPLPAAVLAAGTALSALSATWFFTGIDRPILILSTESLPKILAALISGWLIYLGFSTAIFGVFTIAQVLLSLYLAGRCIDGRMLPRRQDYRKAPAVMRHQAVISLGRSISVVYTLLPTALAASVAPSAVPLFAAVDRLMRMSLAVLAGIPSRLQSWLGSATGLDLAVRQTRTIQLNSLLGVVCGVGFAILAPFVADIVFARSLSIEPMLSWASGALLAIICVSRGVGLALVSMGAANSITAAILPSAIVGLVLLFPLAIGMGALGVVCAGICAELAGLMIQAFLYRRRRFK